MRRGNSEVTAKVPLLFMEKQFPDDILNFSSIYQDILNIL